MDKTISLKLFDKDGDFLEAIELALAPGLGWMGAPPYLVYNGSKYRRINDLGFTHIRNYGTQPFLNYEEVALS